MSEMIIVECDYKDGECLERYEGFSLQANESFREKNLKEAGWSLQDDKHYCPLHKQSKESEETNG